MRRVSQAVAGQLQWDLPQQKRIVAIRFSGRASFSREIGEPCQLKRPPGTKRLAFRTALPLKVDYEGNEFRVRVTSWIVPVLSEKGDPRNHTNQHEPRLLTEVNSDF